MRTNEQLCDDWQNSDLTLEEFFADIQDKALDEGYELAKRDFVNKVTLAPEYYKHPFTDKMKMRYIIDKDSILNLKRE